MLFDYFRIIESQVRIRYRTENFLRRKTIFVQDTLGLKGLLFDLFVFRQAFLLNLANFLHFSLDPLLLFGLMRVPLDCLNIKLHLHFARELILL